MIHNLIKIYLTDQEIRVSDHDRPDTCLAKPRHNFALQCLDNVNMYVSLQNLIQIRGAFGKFFAWSFISVTDFQPLSCVVSF